MISGVLYVKDFSTLEKNIIQYKKDFSSMVNWKNLNFLSLDDVKISITIDDMD